jgi:hypothetical protein
VKDCAGDLILSAIYKVVAEHFKHALALKSIAPEVVDLVPGGVAVIDIESRAADDLDLLVIIKRTAEADEHGIKSRALDRLKHFGRISILLSCLNSVSDHFVIFLLNFAVRLRRS